MRFQVKFKHQPEYKYVHDAAVYLKLTDSQFAQIACLRFAEACAQAVKNKLAEVAAAQAAQAEGVSNVGEPSTSLDSSADAVQPVESGANPSA